MEDGNLFNEADGGAPMPNGRGELEDRRNPAHRPLKGIKCLQGNILEKNFYDSGN